MNPTAMTLSEVWADYQRTRGHRLRASTVKDYDLKLRRAFSDWFDLPLSNISKDAVETRHQELTLAGPALANLSMRILRALFNFVSSKYDLEIKNPVNRLSQVRAWNAVKRRKRHIRSAQIRPWFDAVMTLDATNRDALLLMLFTGMRRSEVLGLCWRDVDLVSGVIALRQTKNGSAFDVPLSDYVLRLLQRRRYANPHNVFVFESRNKPGTPLRWNERAYRLVATASGIKFSPHDLRRTFITIADDLELKSEVVKQLCNHTSNDVTESYTVRSIERLRRATQQITDAILHYAGRDKPQAPPAPIKPAPPERPTTIYPRLANLESEIIDALMHLRTASPAELFNFLSVRGRLRFESVMDIINRLADEGRIAFLDLKPRPLSRMAIMPELRRAP